MSALSAVTAFFNPLSLVEDSTAFVKVRMRHPSKSHVR